jgi:hypothetical protein
VRNLTPSDRPGTPQPSAGLPANRARRYPVRGTRLTFPRTPVEKTVELVIDRMETSGPPRRLTDLSKGQPADATLKNLLGALDAKLDLCARLAVFEWEADREGWTECASAFHRLAEIERRTCSEVIEYLREHLERRASLTSGIGA